MKLLFDFLPVVIFFIIFKFFGIYYATGAAIGISAIQLSYVWFVHHRTEMTHLITFGLLVVLGGATILSHNAIFIKWKPTAIYWVFALLFLGSQYFGKKPLIQRMMDNKISLPENIWKRINLSWTLFFIIIGFANLYVAYHFNTNIWVNFKLFGVLGCTLVFGFIQALYMASYAKDAITISEDK
jgi:intracellular septation protein